MARQTFILLLLIASASPVTAAEAPPVPGQIKPRFTEPSPLRTAAEFRRRGIVYDQSSKDDPVDYDVSAESFSAVVPPSYSASVPHGLMVWVGVTAFSPEWYPVIARHKLLWVESPSSAKRRPALRSGLVIDAVHNMERQYNIDPERIYICGFSAGGLCASDIFHSFPDVFRGVITLNGENYYHGRRSEDGRLEPTVMEVPRWQGDYQRLKKELRIVIVTGEHDTINEPDISQMNFQGLVLDGFRGVTIFQIPRWGHVHPDPVWFEKCVDALDHPRWNAPPTTSPTADKRPAPGQLAQSRRLLISAVQVVDENQFRGAAEQATGYLRQLMNDYPATPSAASGRELLEWIGRNPTTQRTRVLESPPQ